MGFEEDFDGENLSKTARKEESSLIEEPEQTVTKEQDALRAQKHAIVDKFIAPFKPSEANLDVPMTGNKEPKSGKKLLVG